MHGGRLGLRICWIGGAGRQSRGIRGERGPVLVVVRRGLSIVTLRREKIYRGLLFG